MNLFDLKALAIAATLVVGAGNAHAATYEIMFTITQASTTHGPYDDFENQWTEEHHAWWGIQRSVPTAGLLHLSGPSSTDVTLRVGNLLYEASGSWYDTKFRAVESVEFGFGYGVLTWENGLGTFEYWVDDEAFFTAVDAVFSLLQEPEPAPIPLPASAALLPLGLGGLALIRRRQRANNR